MTYLIAEPCIGVKDRSCVDVFKGDNPPGGAEEVATNPIQSSILQYSSKTPLPGPAVEPCLVQGLRHHATHVSDTWLRTLDP